MRRIGEYLKLDRHRRRSHRRARTAQRRQSHARRIDRQSRAPHRSQSRRSCRSRNHESMDCGFRSARPPCDCRRRAATAKRRQNSSAQSRALAKERSGKSRAIVVGLPNSGKVVDHQRLAQTRGGKNGRSRGRHAPVAVVSPRDQHRVDGHARHSRSEDRDAGIAVEACAHRRGSARALRPRGSRRLLPSLAGG